MTTSTVYTEALRAEGVGGDVMTNEKDAKVIHNLFAEYHYTDDLGVIKSKLAEYVATVRKEEREAVWKQTIALAESASQIRAKSPYTQTLELLRTAAQVEASRAEK